MKIFLIVPPQLSAIDPSLPAVLQEEEDPTPPLGLLYIAASLEKSDKQKLHQIRIIDCQLEKINHEKLRNILTEEKPDVIGMTAMTFNMPTIIQVAEIAKQVDANIKIILGGPHVFIYPQETMNIGVVDFLILGEGEITFTELINTINSNGDLHNIKGLVFKENNKVIINELAEPLKDLDSLPFPARHLIKNEKYISALAERTPVTTMITSRGCPFQCIFCNRPHLGKIFRYRSAKNVVSEIEECVKMGIREIFIYDDTFTVNRQRVVDVCNLILEKKLDVYWDIRARVDTVDYELLKLLKRASCVRIHFGIEAGTEKVIKALKKGISLDRVKTAFNDASQVGIKTLAYFMMGSPSETREDILETIKLAKKINPDFAHFSITTPFPATELYTLGLQNKILPNDYWREFAKHPTSDFQPLVWEENLKKEELIKLLQKAYSSFYWRPSYILKSLKKVRSFGELFRKFIAALKLLKI